MIRKRLFKFMAIWIILFIVGVVFIFKSFSPADIISNYLYTYKLDKDASYTVGINKNNFYDSQVMEQDKAYISDLVNNIDIKFKTYYTINTNVNICYDYKIINTVYVKYANNANLKNSMLWTKDYVLKESELNTTKNQNTFTIQDDVSIDYQKYRNQVQNFRSTYNLPIEAYMEVKLITNYDLEIEKTKEKKQQDTLITLKIPLLQEVFSIDKNCQKVETQTFEKSENIKAKVDKPRIIVGIAIILTSLVGVLYLIREQIKINVKNDYEVALNRILKNNLDIIAEVTSPVDIEYMKIIDVKDFNQLLDIEEEIRMPILFCETNPGKEGEFIILYDNIAYRYIITAKN